MPKTLSVQLSDAAIKKHAADLNVATLNDPRHSIRFRYRNDRTRGSWHIVQFGQGKAKWRKAANWPDVSAKTMIDMLPVVSARLMGDPSASATVDGCREVGQVLTWYSDRMISDRTLSGDRRGSTLSAIRCQLLPRLQDVPLSQLNAASLDKLLYGPMQAEYSISYVKSVLGVLKVVMAAAMALREISADPVKDVTFGTFTKAKIRPKGARLRHVAVVDLMASWADLYKQGPQDVAFAVMMLAHGTRISETRKAMWKNIHLEKGEWFIPARDTKSKRDHLLPLTPQVVAFLARYRETQKAQGYDGGYLFPSASRSGKPLARCQSFDIFKRLGAGEWTSHDLRKLARSCWAKLRVDSLVVKLLLNHALTDLEATYFQDLGDDIKREALERWHGWLDAQGFDLFQGETVVRCAAKRNPVDPSGWLA